VPKTLVWVDYWVLWPCWRPDGNWERWLTAFPSFGFILTCDLGKEDEIIELFESQNVTCHEIGEVKEQTSITVLIEDNKVYKFI